MFSRRLPIFAECHLNEDIPAILTACDVEKTRMRKWVENSSLLHSLTHVWKFLFVQISITDVLFQKNLDLFRESVRRGWDYSCRCKFWILKNWMHDQKYRKYSCHPSIFAEWIHMPFILRQPGNFDTFSSMNAKIGRVRAKSRLSYTLIRIFVYSNIDCFRRIYVYLEEMCDRARMTPVNAHLKFLRSW